MKRDCVRLTSKLAIFLFVVMAGRSFAHAQWTKVSGAPNASTCLLLTDGTVMCQAGEQGTAWNRLTPKNGSYANGTWTALQSLPQPSPNPPGYGPLYYASGVLPDGRVFVIGGEYNNGYLGCATPPPPVNNCPTTLGYVFDPTANGGTGQWSGPISVPAAYVGSDNQSITLKDGTTLIADIDSSGTIYKLDPNALTLTLVNASGKQDSNDEEGWTILPDGTVLTVDANNTSNLSTGGGTAYEIYDPTTLTWSSPGYTPVNLADLTVAGKASHEVGPGVLRPDGVVVYFGGNVSGQNATYDTNTKTWATAASFPLNSSNVQLTVPDGPASILPDGNVLVEASPGVSGTTFPAGAQFFEFTLSGGSLNPVSTSGGPSVSGEAAFHGRMLVLPTGEILYTHGGSDVYLYENIGSYQNAWRPVVTAPPPSVLGLGDTYAVSGNLFNGLSMGGSYGDDVQESTNYPLVRITNNGSGHIFYARTHGHSRMGVEAVGDASVISTSFDVPAGMEQGASELVVVTNGIPSENYDVNIEPASAIAFAGGSATTSDYNDPAVVQAVLTAVGGGPLSGKTVTFVLGTGGGTETCSGTTDGSGIASCSLTPNQPAGMYSLTATFAADSSYAGSSVSTTFTVTHEEAAIAFTAASATTSDYDDAATVQAQLTTDGNALANKTVTFVLGSGGSAPTCSATTDASGNATCSLTPNQAAGPYTLTTSFAGDGFYVPASAATTFTVTKEEDTVTFTATSPTVIANGHSTTFAAVLKEDGVTPIAGRSVSITLGTGGSAQTCSGTTDGTGTASCTILVNQPLGPNTVAANFAGDAFYLPSTVSEPVILFAFLSQGSMIVGNLNSAPGTNVEFWGAQWAKDNSLSGGPAPNAFKGFAGTAPQSCGAGGWSSGTGNSPGPPSSVPSYMGVIASSTVGQSGSAISGNVPAIIVVKTSPGYGPSPGHAGTGTVVAVFCP
ncbi:MAG TPA: Ig-like domain-containing protein [Bryocella sp.]|nr:Ig-like domain-containing protein [Bryocella sp.]